MEEIKYLLENNTVVAIGYIGLGTVLTDEPFDMSNGIGWQYSNGEWIAPIVPQEVEVEI